MNNENKIRKAIRKYLSESLDGESEYANMMGEMMVDEERITNDTARPLVQNRENFVASHCFGEKLGGDDYYLVASYGEQFPLFLHDKPEGVWYENSDKYIYNKEVVEQTEEHREMLRPSVKMHLKSLEWMLQKLAKIKSIESIGELTHTSVEPGEKN